MAIFQMPGFTFERSESRSRQLDSIRPPIHALADIRDGVGPAMSLFFDSGLRSGEDVVKAYAQGANFTFLGRILKFAIAAGGEEGLCRLWQVLCDETSIPMAQIGVCDLSCVDLSGFLETPGAQGTRQRRNCRP